MNKILSVYLLGLFVYLSVGCVPICEGECQGSDGSCLSCPDPGSWCSRVGGPNCSAPNKGVYCCVSGGVWEGGGGCDNGCYGSTPWRCGGYCYSSPPSGNHACTRCN